MAIDFNLLQPVDIGGQFLAGLQAAQQQRLQQQQQAEKLARAQRMQQDIAAWKADMSPERTAALFLNYPEIKEQIAASKAVLDDAAKRDRLGFNTRALSLSRAGQKDRVIEMVQQRIAAYRNAGKTKEAAEAQDMLRAYQIDPSVGEGSLVFDIYDDDPKLYETLYGKSEMPLDTSIIKNLLAEGLKMGTPEFQQALRDERTKVTITDPRIGFFSGPAEEFRRRFGGEPPANAQRGSPPVVNSEAAFNALKPGTQFKAPDGSIRTKPGGGSGNATGGFQ